LYSFPHKLGAGRICYTAWEQVNGLVAAGADVMVHAGALHRPVPDGVEVRTTLARGKLRIPYKALGTMRALALHDYIVSKRLKKLAGKIDLIHAWPSAARQTLKAAAALGIPTVIERPNAHTRYAYESVQREAKRLGIVLPADNEYAFKTDVLEREEEEYRLADYILCPSDFTVKTFVEYGLCRNKLVRHLYGYDDQRFYPDRDQPPSSDGGLTMLFAGDCAVRKGVHFALEAWLGSPARHNGAFLIAGNFLPAYADKLSSMLSDRSVRVLGHRNDLPDLMRKSDILVLPSIEEGFGLVVAEGMGSGCVPLISEACTDICRHMQNGLVHRIGDVDALRQHITMLHEDRALLARLRIASLEASRGFTWTAAGARLLSAYQEVLGQSEKQHSARRIR
jgi:glycosyltransferase involved in cell wall biosynthesis